MADSSQLLYSDQLREVLHILAPGLRSPGSMEPVVQILVRNATENDDTDKKLDWYSIAVFETVTRDHMPAYKETKVLDLEVVAEYEQRFADDFPPMWRPGIVEHQFNFWLEHAENPPPVIADSREEWLIVGFFARVATISYILERVAEGRGGGYEQLVDEYILLGALRLRDYQEDGAFLPHWELPPVP